MIAKPFTSDHTTHWLHESGRTIWINDTPEHRSVAVKILTLLVEWDEILFRDADAEES